MGVIPKAVREQPEGLPCELRSDDAHNSGIMNTWMRRTWMRRVCTRLSERLKFWGPRFTPTTGLTLMKNSRLAILGTVTLIMLASGVAQQAAKHVLSGDELKKAVPTEYFFRGQKAPVQVRNSVEIGRAHV